MNDLEFDADQSTAVNNCLDLSRRIVAVTGGPGTGKTTILKTVYEQLKDKHRSVVICAPTGKAANRIQEATGITAMTIHRLLEYPHPGDRDEKTGKPLLTTEPRRDRHNPIDFNCVLSDEYAMVSEELHRNLLDALPPGGLIRMFGDANQLAPIEQNKARQNLPSPFVTILNKFTSTRLLTNHRQHEGSGIVDACGRILRGVIPKVTDDFKVVRTEHPVDIITEIIRNGNIDLRSMKNQIIVPTNIGWVGTVAISALIQTIVQPNVLTGRPIERHKWSKSKSLTVCDGDKIIYCQNNYGLGLFNGDTGIVEEIDVADQITVNFGYKRVTIPPAMEVQTRRGFAIINPQKDIELGYAITTHKAQGSEFDNVLFVMNRSRPFNLCRRNLYTGVSRARKFVQVITDPKALSLSLYRMDQT